MLGTKIWHDTNSTARSRGKGSKRLTGDASVELVDPAGGKLSHNLRMYMDRQAFGD
jgi:hypothetical protein